MRPVEAIMRAVAVMYGDTTEPFSPLMVAPMAEGPNPVDVSPDDKSIDDSRATALDSLHTQDQEQIVGTASYVSPDCPPPFAAPFAEIEVDVDTGQVTVIKLLMAVDCGVAINPVTASGQVEDGVAPALPNAILHATGVGIDQLPCIPERVWQALDSEPAA